MKIIVTGGAGFIGSWVCDTYIENGHDVLIIDNLSSGLEENINKKAKFINCDIRNYSEVEKIFNSFKPDIVNHHAAQINVRVSVDNPTYDAEVNIIGSLNICKLCVDHKVDKLIFSSTGGAIYGEPKSLPADEKSDTNPLSPYGLSKLSVENYILYYNKTYGLDYVILRYSNVYGERQNPHGEAGVVAIFCTNILEQKPCYIFGDGEQTRDYVHVSDVANANLLALNANNGIYNIGTSVETSVNQIVLELKKTTKIEFVVVNEKERSGEVKRISIDNKYASHELNWKPENNFNEGINRTWKWFKQFNN